MFFAGLSNPLSRFVRESKAGERSSPINCKVKASDSISLDNQVSNSRAAEVETNWVRRGNGLRSKTHEPVLFERSEFTGECAEQLIEIRELCTAARRCRGYRGIPPVLLFFFKQKENAETRKCEKFDYSGTRRQSANSTFIPCRLRGNGASSRRTLQMRANKIVRGSRANDIRPYRALFHYSLLPITLSEAKQTPQSWLRRASSPAGEPKAGEPCLLAFKIYAILNSALRRDSP